MYCKYRGDSGKEKAESKCSSGKSKGRQLLTNAVAQHTHTTLNPSVVLVILCDRTSVIEPTPRKSEDPWFCGADQGLRMFDQNITTGEMSQAITPYHFFDYPNFFHLITFLTRVTSVNSLSVPPLSD